MLYWEVVVGFLLSKCLFPNVVPEGVVECMVVLCSMFVLCLFLFQLLSRNREGIQTVPYGVHVVLQFLFHLCYFLVHLLEEHMQNFRHLVD